MGHSSRNGFREPLGHENMNFIVNFLRPSGASYFHFFRTNVHEKLFSTLDQILFAILDPLKVVGQLLTTQVSLSKDLQST